MLDSTVTKSPAEVGRVALEILKRAQYDGASIDMFTNYLLGAGYDTRAGQVRIVCQGDTSKVLAERNAFADALPCNFRVFYAHAREKFAKDPTLAQIAEAIGEPVNRIRQAQRGNHALPRWYCRLAEMPDVPRPPRKQKQGKKSPKRAAP